MEVHTTKLPTRSKTCSFIETDASIGSWTVLAGGDDGSITKIQYRNAAEIPVTKDRFENIHQGEITCISTSVEGTQFVSCSKTGQVKSGLASSMTVHSTVDVQSIVNSVYFLHGAPSKVMIASKDGQVRILSLDRNQVETSLPNSHRGNPITEAVPLDESHYVTASTDCSSHLNDIRSPQAQDIVFQHPNWVYGVSSVDPTCIATACRDSNVYLWDSRRAETPVEVLSSFNAGATCCSFSRNGRVLAAGSTDRSVVVWDVQPGRVVRSWKLERCFENGLADVRVSSNRQLLATVTHDGTLRLFDLACEDRQKAKAFTESARMPLDIGETLTKFLW